MFAAMSSMGAPNSQHSHDHRHHRHGQRRARQPDIQEPNKVPWGIEAAFRDMSGSHIRFVQIIP
jgi:hypothetical protein